MTIEEIKIRQLTNQSLITTADKLTVVRDLCGIQSQFMVNAMHSLRIRCNDFDEATVADGLVKNWTLRGTVHVFAEDDLPLFIRCHNGSDYLSDNFSGRTFWNQRDCWALTPERQRELSRVIVTAIGQQLLTRDELKEVCRAHGMTEAEEGSMFDPWGGGIRELCERGFMNYVVQEPKAYCPSPRFTPLPDDVAKLEIARRYFTNIAPATIHDAMYFLGAKQSEVKSWLSQLPVNSTECGGKTYYYIENGKRYDHGIPDCLFLAGFDQLMLGYQKKESLYLSEEHLRGIFNLAGIVMPAILLRGTVIGKWKKKNRKLTISLFTSVTFEDMTVIEDKAVSLWGDTIEIIKEN
ncbi:MAG: winged helix DNA-binding domain-containing protein [Clostridia bacterium]|nr:winged helix DNA-binding domain-containing protein [Clostridia bacterium]